MNHSENHNVESCPFLPFKKCTACAKIWRSCSEFLSDPELLLAGYQTNFLDPGKGFFVFHHNAPGCGTTLGVAADAFSELYSLPLMIDRPKNIDEQDCLYHSNFMPRPARCECEYVRAMVEIIKNWRKA